MSWWNLKVSTPFSLLCLILLSDFHKNASFRPNMLNYLNTIFTFGKQTEDNFINRKFQCTPATHSFTHFRAHFSYGGVAGTAGLGGPEIPHGQLHSQKVPLGPHQDGNKQGRRCSHATWSLDELRAAFLWV